jgi:hypothetical protein
MYDSNDATVSSNPADSTTESGAVFGGGAEHETHTHDALFTLHDGTDTRDGHSRLAHHLAQNRWMFRDSKHKLTSDPARFTAAAFQAGTAPIMNPPYIGTHPRVVRAYPRSDTQGRYVLMAELVIPTPRKIAVQLPGDIRGWQRNGRGEYRPALEYDRVLAYVRLTLGVPIRPDLLPEPGYDERGVPYLDIARRALRAVTTHASAVCAPLLGSLEDTAQTQL